LTCADSVIAEIKEHYTSDVHVDNKRVKSVIIDMKYDTSTHRVEKKAVDATVVALGTDGSFETMTGGQAEEET